ncbi:hypothetical protein KGP36_06510 [Patescibacteria group bacterium]|nr:hypothetical protein [Patescibacteria group bacterium]
MKIKPVESYTVEIPVEELQVIRDMIGPTSRLSRQEPPFGLSVEESDLAERIYRCIVDIIGYRERKKT